ncbi:flavin-containing monooxygenase [Winogradskyella bathintestinalis]|uniref:NAD(P)/FAD-dependent oxidoreductase n=1 Tax=Winogradskyella bathintestinalis TaxID=3035208 RepID=A0ABT7ZS70_9FLAO|nr:NAD(P)/FAD-dependent oxidoreductase [Winogradskyella bathintestinalis]MDN3491860.1 NAD(P)/FAD-dependent oxidoreductase [Winogradskyella bathintestinalis]
MKDFVIIGAAQAGLSMAYFLQQKQKDFLIIDREEEIGASWLNRWSSLKLFTPTEFNHLPGMSFPALKGHYPDKYEVADYFKQYVERFKFPIQLHTLAERIEKKGNEFIIKTNQQIIRCKQVIIATGPFHIPYTPKFHTNLSDHIYQVHSNYYKTPNQLQKGATLVVGGGDSGFQILDEISKHTNEMTYFSGSTDIRTLPQEILGKTLWWWFTITGFLSFSKTSWIGKKINQSKQPIIGTDVQSIITRYNVETVGRTLNADSNTIITATEKLTDIKNIIWATGYKPNFEWIEDIVLTHDGYPKHHRGISTTKGLYFIGLPWLHTRGSATLGGVKKDAAYLAKAIL